MDTKRLVVAIAVSIAIVVGWNYVAGYLGILPAPTAVVEQQQTSSGATNSVASVVSETKTTELSSALLSSPVMVVDTPLYTAEFAVNGGTIRSFILKGYTTTSTNSSLFQVFNSASVQFAPLGILINAEPMWGQGEWTTSSASVTLNGDDVQTITIQGIVGTKRIRREITFSAKTYLITEKTQVEVLGNKEAVQLAYTLGTGTLATYADYNATQVALYLNDSLKTIADKEDLAEGIEDVGTINWVGVMDHYFLAAIVPTTTQGLTARSKYEGEVYRTALYEPQVMVAEDTTSTFQTSYWIGPKEAQLLDLAPNKLSASVNYGFFSFLSKPLVLFLEFIYTYVQNYGVAIILLTLIIKLIFWPLSQKSFTSMNKMKKIQPLVQKIREKYADNKEEMNKEIMTLYKTYKVNPMGGCLPLLVQIPVFFALYEALLNSLALRHAMFIEYVPFTKIIWLADLSTKDPLYITPILMGISMLLQQLITPSTGDPTQRKIMLIMPVVFTIFFLGFPSGLVLYWLASNVISIIQQWLMLRRSDTCDK